jgi:epoxyqueuosine reductase
MTAAVPHSPAEATRLVKEAARAEGFDLVGVARAEPLDPGPLDHWLAHGWDAQLSYVRDSRDKRLDVTEVLPGARSVVAVAVAYHHPDPPKPTEPFGVVARYARGRDYHNVLRRPLKRLRARVEALVPGSVGYASCDSRPVAEKAWAQRAGLGWTGKNGCLIAPPYGSWVLLGCVVTTAELVPDEPHPDRCGTCVACLTSCPTDAIPEPRYIDATRCIANHTIEHRDPLPPAVAAKLGGRLFGCDACQEVCPWNREAEAGRGALAGAFAPHDGQSFVPLEALLHSSAEALEARVHGTPLARAGVPGLTRTAQALQAESE